MESCEFITVSASYAFYHNELLVSLYADVQANYSDIYVRSIGGSLRYYAAALRTCYNEAKMFPASKR